VVLGEYESMLFEGPLDLGKRFKLQDKVNVLVRAGLLAQERIDSPAAIQPHSESGSLECVKDLQDVGGSHESPVYFRPLQARRVRLRRSSPTPRRAAPSPVVTITSGPDPAHGSPVWGVVAPIKLASVVVVDVAAVVEVVVAAVGHASATG
jgi:hypothetical protein